MKKFKRMIFINITDVITFLFMAIVYGSFMIFLFVAKPTCKEDVITYFENNNESRETFVNLYGASQRMLQKYAIENFSIFKDNCGKLHQPRDKISDNYILESVDKLLPINQYCKLKNTPFVYFTSLLPISKKDNLPYSNLDYSYENAIALKKQLINERVPVFDLRESGILSDIDQAQLFYKTDHHWTTETAFNCFQYIAEYLYNEKSINLDMKWINESNYNVLEYKNSFLGSYGIKVGSYYAGKDDFRVFVPISDGDFTYESHDSNGSILLKKRGNWFNTLMDQEILDDVTYHNKYNAWLNAGSVLNRIENNTIQNDTKILLISHSYGRPLAQYLSLCAKEIRHLDPQDGRYNGNIIEYIDDFDPDIVLFFCEFEGELIGNYNVETVTGLNN